jgi:CRP-like cAMP-binding protein
VQFTVVNSLGEKIRLRDGRFQLLVKNKELAALLGVTPEHRSRVLTELAIQHAIDLEDRWIIVRDPEKLRPLETVAFISSRRS